MLSLIHWYQRLQLPPFITYIKDLFLFIITLPEQKLIIIRFEFSTNWAFKELLHIEKLTVFYNLNWVSSLSTGDTIVCLQNVYESIWIE